MFELSLESAFLHPQFFHFALMSALYGQKTPDPFAFVFFGPYLCPDLLDPDADGLYHDLSLSLSILIRFEFSSGNDPTPLPIASRLLPSSFSQDRTCLQG